MPGGWFEGPWVCASAETELKHEGLHSQLQSSRTDEIARSSDAGEAQL